MCGSGEVPALSLLNRTDPVTNAFDRTVSGVPNRAIMLGRCREDGAGLLLPTPAGRVVAPVSDVRSAWPVSSASLGYMPRDLDKDLEVASGLMRTAQLHTLGYSPGAIARAVATGALRRPRRGWVCSPAAPTPAVRAVELGGRLGGASALVSHGVWVDHVPGLVVACAPTASRLALTKDRERRIWMPDRFPRDTTCQWRVSVLDALLQFALNAPRDSIIASVDSALQQRAISAKGVDRLFAALPRRFRSLRREIDGSAMSGTESHMRLALRRAGYRVHPQAQIPSVGRVDLLVDEWLIVELDSREHHQSGIQQLRDRERDGNAVLTGYGHARFMWSHVRDSMDWCLAVVAERMRDGPPTRVLRPSNRTGGGTEGHWSW